MAFLLCVKTPENPIVERETSSPASICLISFHCMSHLVRSILLSMRVSQTLWVPVTTASTESVCTVSLTIHGTVSYQCI